MHTTAQQHTPPPLTASAPKARIQALDLIRGVAILGILAVNADGFAAPMAASLNPLTWLFPNEGATALSYWFMDTFFHEKFVALFSMLFGISLYLVGGERSDAARGRILARRLAVLLVFGLLHGFGIWWGDILTLYAVTGGLMYFCRSWPPARLLCIGVVLFTAATLVHVPVSTRPSAPTAAALAKGREAVAATLAEAKGSWRGAYAVNARQYRRLLSGYPRLLPSTLGLMMIGLGLFKSGFFAARSGTRAYVAAGAIGAATVVPIGWICWLKDVAATPLPGGDAILALGAPVVGIGYAAALVLLLRVGAGPALAPFAAAGRMAFTNYLTQSLIMTSVFYGGRGSLMGEVDRPALWALVAGVWVLQLVWSPLWLSRFEMGPFEWVWRCLTVGRRVPLLITTAGVPSKSS